MTDFYLKDELHHLYQQMKRKPYSNKEPWEKFLSNDASRSSKKKKKIREYEIPFEMDNLQT